MTKKKSASKKSPSPKNEPIAKVTSSIPKPVAPKKPIVKKDIPVATKAPEVIPVVDQVKKESIKKEEPKIEVSKKSETQNTPDVISFYSHNIRFVYTSNQWYFCLEDILKVANVVDPTKFLIDLKNQTDLKDNYYQFVDSFSYHENDNPIIIPIVNYQSFIQLLPYIRQIGSTIPGPFPEWLKNMASRSF